MEHIFFYVKANLGLDPQFEDGVKARRNVYVYGGVA